MKLMRIIITLGFVLCIRFPCSSQEDSDIKNGMELQTGANFNIDGNGFIGGVFGIGTESVFDGYRLQVNGPTVLTPGSSNGRVEFSTPNSELGMAILNTNRADVRFDGKALKMVAGPAGSTPPNSSGIAITTDGNVGIGTDSPGPDWKLQVNGRALLNTGGNGGALHLSAPNGETGIGIVGTNRADLRFDGSTIKLVATTGNSVPPARNGISIHTSGNVSVGNGLTVNGEGTSLSVNGNSVLNGNTSLKGAVDAGTTTINNGLTIASGNATINSGSLNVFGSIYFSAYAGTGGANLCYNETTNGIARCVSSLRYKADVTDFKGGLEIVNQLHPIQFVWKSDGKPDVGFAAEEIDKIEPLLSTRNPEGVVEGVKYEQLSTVLVNAVKDQQEQIEQLQAQVTALKQLICAEHPDSNVCR